MYCPQCMNEMHECLKK